MSIVCFSDRFKVVRLYFFTDRSKVVSFVDPIISHAVLSVNCSLMVTCRESTNLLALLYVMFSSLLGHFPIWCSGSGVVLDYIHS